MLSLLDNTGFDIMAGNHWSTIGAPKPDILHNASHVWTIVAFVSRISIHCSTDAPEGQ